MKCIMKEKNVLDYPPVMFSEKYPVYQSHAQPKFSFHLNHVCDLPRSNSYFASERVRSGIQGRQGPQAKSSCAAKNTQSVQFCGQLSAPFVASPPPP